ncbi:MAG: L-threonylcarbamoyladenylate synthase [Rhodospirillales bacterium]
MTGDRILRPPTAEAVAEAGALIGAGRLVAFPTETVYGLGGDAGNDLAVAAIFAAKNRPQFNPLIVHVDDVGAADRLAWLDARAETLARRFWPGPLTLVLRRRERAPLAPLVSAGLATVALRVPAHPLALALIRAAGRPIAAPSANPSGRVSPTLARHVVAELGDKVAMVLDGGPCRVGVESTVVDLSEATPFLLRPGGLAIEAIEAVIGPLASPTPGAPRAPGMLARHYAPTRPLRLDARDAAPGEVLLGFGDVGAGAALSLSRAGNLEEAAANLFQMLRALDRTGVGTIAVAPIPDVGLGRAINDRLRRAATRDDQPPAGQDDADDATALSRHGRPLTCSP